MRHVLVAGAGKMGQLIATLLATTGDYDVHLVDISIESINLDIESMALSRIHVAKLDTQDEAALQSYIRDHDIMTLISSLPYFCNPRVGRIARKNDLFYFDLTEDESVSAVIREIAQGTKKTFVGQCGLAPGFISILTNDYLRRFDEVENVLMRVGALPKHAHHTLKYALTWSTEGLINEYGNPCVGIADHQLTLLRPLEGREMISIDGLEYEAFNTSGGLGTLAHTYEGKVRNMNYKTLRYPGHCDGMRLLMNTLKLNEDRDTLKRILEKAIPRTRQDVVVIYVTVNGMQEGQFVEETYVKKIYPQIIAGKEWLAIQVTAAASLCAVVDMVLHAPEKYEGFIRQEQFSLQHFLTNRFGQYYNHQE